MSSISPQNILQNNNNHTNLPRAFSLQEEETLYSGIDLWLSAKGVHVSTVQESLDHFYDKKRKQISMRKGVPAIGSVCLGANLSGNKLMARRRLQLSNTNTPELKFSNSQEKPAEFNLKKYCLTNQNRLSTANTELTLNTKDSDLLLLNGPKARPIATNVSRTQF